jgi:membrane-bound lytic murein transglycosylase D
MKLHRIAFLVGLAWLAGLAYSAPRKVAKSFVPPPFPVIPVETIQSPPEPDSPRGAGVLVNRSIPVQPPLEAEMRIAIAQQRFEIGRDLYESGETGKARVEFDGAIEVLLAAPAGMAGRVLVIRKHDQLVEEIYRIESQSGQSADGPDEPILDPSPLEEIAGMTFPVEPGLKNRVLEQIQSTVSQLPLEMADPVVSLINYFSSPRGRKVLVAGLTRMGRYAPMIRRILDEEGLPPELIFMAQAESGFLPRAVSWKMATGMWQFVQWRGREYGLMQTAHTDDRLDPLRATRAAARHLRDLYQQFGDWHLAIAAYNCGPNAVERGVQRTGYADFWELYKRNVLPRETANYVPIILAITIMAKNAKDYGIEGIVQDPPIEYDTITMTADTHLALIADLAGQGLQQIKDLNTGVLRVTAPKEYSVHVPKGMGKRVLAGLEAVPPEKRMSWRVHRVGTSETLATISRLYKVSDKTVSSANGADSLEPQVGDLIVVPVAYPGVKPEVKAKAKRRSTRAASSRKTPARKSSASGKTPPKKPATSKSGSPRSRTQARPSAANRQGSPKLVSARR